MEHISIGGLYCPPLIPARIWQNLGNSWNSRGINFGTGACQIDYTILAECRMEFIFCQNGSRIHMDGMAPRMTGTESSTPKSSIGKCWCSIWASSTHQFVLPQPPPSPPSTMPIHHYLLSTITSLPPSHYRHHHHWPPLFASITHNHHNTNDVAMPCHPVNKDQPWLHDRIQGAMSLTATWQTTNSDIVIVCHLHPKWVLITIPHFVVNHRTRCHIITLGDVATKWWMMTKVIVRHCHLSNGLHNRDTMTTLQHHDTTTTSMIQPPPQCNTTMVRMPCSGNDNDDAHETNEHNNTNGQQTWQCRWMTMNMTMSKNGEWQHLLLFVIVVYSVSKDPLSPFVFLTPIPVATSPMATFGNWTTDTFIVHHHSLFYYT